MKTKSIGGAIFDFSNYVLLTLLMLATVYPLLYVLFASLSDPSEIIAHSGLLVKPLGFTFNAYEKVFGNPMILKSYLNTILYVVVGLIINLLLTSFGAYALSRRSLRFRKQLTLYIVFTMFFSGGLIPTYLIVNGMGITNTIWAMVLPGAISTFNLLIMRTSFESIPVSLEESAKIDGANDIVILFRVFLPLSLPVLAVMCLYYGVSHWNAWFNAMIYLKDRARFPLQLILREILIQGDMTGMSDGDVGASALIAETVKYATIIVATVPVLFIYPFLQRYFVKGALIGAVKG